MLWLNSSFPLFQKYTLLLAAQEAFNKPLNRFNISSCERGKKKINKSLLFNTLLSLCPWSRDRQNNLLFLESKRALGLKIATTQRGKKPLTYFSKSTLLIQMLLIVQETSPPLLQAVTVKNVAINQGSSVKYTCIGVRRLEEQHVRSGWNLSVQKYSAFKRGGGFSCFPTERMFNLCLQRQHLQIYLDCLLWKGPNSQMQENCP